MNVSKLPNKPNVARFKTAVTGFALASMLLGIAGCGNSEFEKPIQSAKEHLRLSRNDKALNELSISNDQNAPAEYHYVKAITLDRLGRNEAAMAEIARATEKADDNPKYKGLELRFRLFARDRSSVDQLIELNRKFASTSAVALFSTYGFHAKEMLLKDEKKPQAAKYHHERKLKTLETAFTLSKEMPELHPELLNFAVLYQKSDQALRLVDELLALDEDSIQLKDKKIKVLLQLKMPNEASKIARAIYKTQRTNRKAGESFAAVLAQTSGSDEHDEWFDDLIDRFPVNTVVMSKYSVYLTRTGRMAAAHTVLDNGIKRVRKEEDKESLAFIAVTLPLEVGSPEIADIALRKYEQYLKEKLLVEYFHARILFLQRRYSEAVQKMLTIVDEARKRQDGSRILATEALVWIRRILADKVLKEQMERVLGATEKQDRRFEVKVATEAQIKAAKEARAEAAKKNAAKKEQASDTEKKKSDADTQTPDTETNTK
jgi:tetratricopeptide (TPR) repeat protein